MNDTTNDLDKARDDRARERGLELVTHCRITRDGDIWFVPHVQRDQKRCRVKLDPPYCVCNCADFGQTRRPCCHIYAARFAERRMRGEPIPERVYPLVVPPGAPPWVTEELVQATLRQWQAEYPDRLTPDDALVMILAIAEVFNVNRNRTDHDGPPDGDPPTRNAA